MGKPTAFIHLSPGDSVPKLVPKFVLIWGGQHLDCHHQIIAKLIDYLTSPGGPSTPVGPGSATSPPPTLTPQTPSIIDSMFHAALAHQQANSKGGGGGSLPTHPTPPPPPPPPYFNSELLRPRRHDSGTGSDPKSPLEHR